MRHVSRWILLCSFAVMPLTASAADFEGLFKGHTLEEPGCTVGVARQGQPEKFGSYGAADLEHAVPNTTDTIMEAGSVSKQFTAAAILMLAEEGKLKLTDDIRKYIPEMPDYGTPITINHLLSHTNGVRDWAELSILIGWPRWDIVRTNQEVMQIIARQKGLNFKPGEMYSYNNSGYNLATTIVERVSGKTLPQFTRERIFTPLGMTHTSWRENFRLVVPNRAIAYREKTAEGYMQEMPFEDTYGPGALRTTVHDLLTWNNALAAKKLGEFVVSHLEEQAVLNNGRKIAYARGLQHGTYKGLPEISHGGSTAAFRAWVARFPSINMSVAVLCNGAAIDAAKLGRDAIDALRPATPNAPVPEAKSSPATSAELSQAPGLYVEERGHAVRIVASDAALKYVDIGLENVRETVLARVDANRFKRGGTELTFKNGVMESRGADGDVTVYRKAETYTPAAGELDAVVGRYTSAEANSILNITLKDGHLVITPADRPSFAREMKPLWKDAFRSEEGLIMLVRGTSGKVEGITYRRPRVFGLTFTRAAK